MIIHHEFTKMVNVMGIFQLKKCRDAEGDLLKISLDGNLCPSVEGRLSQDGEERWICGCCLQQTLILEGASEDLEKEGREIQVEPTLIECMLSLSWVLYTDFPRTLQSE